MTPKVFLRFSISKKIALGFFVVLSLSGFMVAIGFSRLEAIRQVAEELRPFAGELTHTRNIGRSFNALDAHLEQFVTTGGEDSRAAIQDDIASIGDDIKGLTLVQAPDTNPVYLERTGFLVGILRQRIETFLFGVLSANSRNFNEELQGVYETFHDAQDARTELVKHLDEQFVARVDTEREIIAVAVRTFFLLELLTLLVGLVASVGISRLISAPIRALNFVANKIAEGDYLARADIRQSDEVGELGRSFNTMAEHLSQYTHDLEEQVIARTKELSDKVLILDELNQRLDKNAALLIARDEELTEANEKLRELDQAKSDFLSVASHQLRTPLSAVHWVNSVLLEEGTDKLSPEQKSYIMKAEESNNRMIHLVDDMLTITRIESGKMDYHFYPLALKEILSTMMIDFTPKADAKGLTFSFSVEPNIKTEASVDSGKIRFVFENLLENAIRYTPKKGTVLCSLTRNRDMLAVAIKDSGIGIPKKEQKNIFTKFYRGTNATGTVTDGSGLGLFVARAIVLKHGGTITFESVPGRGSTFTVLLPAAVPVVSPPAVVGSADTTGQASSTALSGLPRSP